MKKAIRFFTFVSFLVLFQSDCMKESNPIAIEPDDQVKAFININLLSIMDENVDTN